jgi:hypothetical protein
MIAKHVAFCLAHKINPTKETLKQYCLVKMRVIITALLASGTTGVAFVATNTPSTRTIASFARKRQNACRLPFFRGQGR